MCACVSVLACVIVEDAVAHVVCTISRNCHKPADMDLLYDVVATLGLPAAAAPTVHRSGTWKDLST